MLPLEDTKLDHFISFTEPSGQVVLFIVDLTDFKHRKCKVCGIYSVVKNRGKIKSILILCLIDNIIRLKSFKIACHKIFLDILWYLKIFKINLGIIDTWKVLNAIAIKDHEMVLTVSDWNTHFRGKHSQWVNLCAMVQGNLWKTEGRKEDFWCQPFNYETMLIRRWQLGVRLLLTGGLTTFSLNANQFLDMWLNPQNIIHLNTQINKVSVDYYSSF